MLNIKDLHASYGGIKALRGVSLHVDAGEIVAVLGSNGAGKSTLLKTISAIVKPDSGEITLEGEKTPTVPYRVVETGIVHVPEGRRIIPNLTVYDNLQIGCFLRKDRDQIKKDLELVYAYFPILKERKDQYGGLLSGGEQQMLALGRGLMARPKIMMLDEPSLGLAPIIVNQIFEILTTINKDQNTTILIVEQNAYKALSIADRGYMMTTGEITSEGPAKALLKAENLEEIYLGQTAARKCP
jgi:branched-chain amino acid transport system ATP-binding protein